MKDTKRALRRHHRQRMIARARNLYLWHELGPNNPDVREWAQHNYNHLKVCSCWMCGHRRKWHGPTIQEMRHDQSVRYGDK